MKPHNKLVTLMFTTQILTVVGLFVYWDPIWLLASVLGIFLFVSVGTECYLHRYLSHQTYKVSKPVEIFMHICSVFSLQGPATMWAANHITHHKYSDRDGDPHPASKGWKSWFWISTYRNSTLNLSTLKRLLKDPLCTFTKNHYFKIYIITVLLFALIDVKIAIYFFLLPAMFSFHSAGFVTVLLHKYGYRNFDTPDTSHNFWLAHFFTGSPLHNNHHANPGKYNDAVKPNEFDLHGLLIQYILRKL